jgi:hypothetical protein
MTEANTRVDGRGRRNCRECHRLRKQVARKRKLVAHHKDATFTGPTAWDEALAKNEPVVLWEKNRRGVWIHTYIYDPHADTGTHNRAKTACKRNHEFTEANTILKSDGSRQCRKCKQAHNSARYATPIETPLLAAARTDI